jgi:DNA-binding LacI/PurR family transcriptional regulator
MAGVTIRDVAREAGVSTATVSYVLNGSRRVGDETRERVLQTARRLGYRANFTARNLQASETRLLGYSWRPSPIDQFNPILDQFLQSIAEAAARHDYRILAFPSIDVHEELSAYEEMMLIGQVDGFILTNTNFDDERVLALLKNQFPFVSFGRANEDWDFLWIDVDGKAGTLAATRHLIAQGHQRIAFLAWPGKSQTGYYRLQGYLDGLSEAGLPADPDWVQLAGNFYDESYAATQRLLALPSDRRPSAIVASSDLMACGRAQRRLGRRAGGGARAGRGGLRRCAHRPLPAAGVDLPGPAHRRDRRAVGDHADRRDLRQARPAAPSPDAAIAPCARVQRHIFCTVPLIIAGRPHGATSSHLRPGRRHHRHRRIPLPGLAAPGRRSKACASAGRSTSGCAGFRGGLRCRLCWTRTTVRRPKSRSPSGWSARTPTTWPSLDEITPADLLPGAVDFIQEAARGRRQDRLGSASKNAQAVIDRLGIADLLDVIADGSQRRVGPSPRPTCSCGRPSSWAWRRPTAP